MDKQEYLKDPCKASSLSFRKTNITVIPDDMLILRDDEFSSQTSAGKDDPYFKLIHRMKHVEYFPLPEEFEIIQCDAADFADHIQECYDGTDISAEILREYQTSPAYDPRLWIAVGERNRKKIIASGIAEYDPQVGEGVFEWIQVSPAYRRRTTPYGLQKLFHRVKAPEAYASGAHILSMDL